MMNLFLFISFVFLLTFILGKKLEKIRIPWIFASLLLGLLLAIYNPFKDVVQTNTFSFLANLGMYFLLFIIGFELNLKEMLKNSKFIFEATSLTILSGAFFGSLIIYFILHIFI